MSALKSLGWPGFAYAAVGLALWPIPVFGLLHAEASAVLAATAFFVAGLTSAGRFAPSVGVERSLPGPELLRHLRLLAIPWALLTVTLLWRPNAGYGLGLVLFLTMVPPSAVLGVAVAWAATARLGRRTARWTVVAVGVVAAVGGVVWDLGFHPQLFTYNHVFGGVLGPIYDSELAVRPGLFAFRGLTILWATGLLMLGQVARGGRGGWLTVVIGAVIAIAYASSVTLGFSQSAAGLQRALGASTTIAVGERPAYRLHYDPRTLPQPRMRQVAADLLWNEARIHSRLGVRPSVTVDVYLYPDAETKGALIGSRETSVVPVWLATPQMHLLQDRVEASLGHELAHVVARELAPPPLHAPLAVGLIEGVAVAVEPPDGQPSAEQTVAAGRALDDVGGLDDPAAVAEGVLSPWFWTQRAGVAYATSGAFVGWLLDTHGAPPLRDAYRSGDIAGAYGVPADTLAAAWARHLITVSVGEEARSYAAWRLRQPSLFEMPSPHHVPRERRLSERGWRALDDGRAADASVHFSDALDIVPTLETAVVGYARARMAEDTPVLSSADLDRLRLDSLSGPSAWIAVGDARKLLGRSPSVAYAEAERLLPPGAIETRTLLQMRHDLSRRALANLVATPGSPKTAASRLETDAPVFAALLWRDADRPDRAWAVARTVCLDAASGPRDPDARAALLGISARLVLRGGAFEDARRRAAAAARAAGQMQRDGMARFYRDLAVRARWSDGQARRVREGAPSTVRPASIFAPPLPPADAPPPSNPGASACAAPSDRRARDGNSGDDAPGSVLRPAR